MDYTSIDLGHEDLDLTDSGMRLRRTEVEGLRVLTEHIPAQRSVAIGFWIGAGSRDEDAGAEGSTHFLEHLLFKGTATRSAMAIAEETDFLGGEFNAMTAKQFTCYHGKVFSDDVAQATDLLADMVTSARLDEADMLTERGVILDELAMYADDPSEVAHEALPAAVLGDHPMSRPVGGTRESVMALDHGHMRGHYERYYRPGELVVTAAGEIDHDEFTALVEATLARYGWEGGTATDRRLESPLSYQPADKRIEMPGEQTALLVGMPGLVIDDPDRYALSAATTILGSGTSSRLFQEIREKRGLAYSAYAYSSSYHSGGLFVMGAPTAPSHVDEVLELMNATFDEMVSGGVSESERESAFRRLRAGLVFDAESVQQRMLRMGLAELVTGKLTSLDETLERARAVTVEDINRVMTRLASSTRATVMAGPR